MITFPGKLRTRIQLYLILFNFFFASKFNSKSSTKFKKLNILKYIAKNIKSSNINNDNQTISITKFIRAQIYFM